MSEYFSQYFDLNSTAIFLSFWFCLPGILLILSGIRSIRTEKAVVVSTNSKFRWKKPGILKGKDAVKEGKSKIIFGVILFLMGLMLIIGTLQ